MKRWRIKPSLGCASAFLVLTAAPALATDDGGTRSVFAVGAGTRALSMGGAYAAVADDASATIWNPGGLGFLGRHELQASHATLYGLGFDEQYALLSLPSWRWGVTAFSFRHFGVGGIEQRTADNVLLEDELSRSETELALSYGKALGTFWSVGASLKLRRLNFGERSDGALGVDIGVLGHPLAAMAPGSPFAQRLRLGLAVRNIVQPSLRLESESVPDPTGIRAGLAYHLPWGLGRGLLLSADLEKTDGMDLRPHGGMELRLHPMLALRAGVQQGGFTAGTGVQWRDVGVDYTFENNAFDTVQRVGVSLRFGSSTVDRRRASLQAEEQALQEALAHRFEQRQSERVDDLIRSAEAEQRAGRLADALELLTTAQILDPDRGHIQRLQNDYHRQLGQQLEESGNFVAAASSYMQAAQADTSDTASRDAVARCRAKSDERAARSEALRQRFAAGLDALAADDLPAAREQFAQILTENPQDQEAAAMVERVDESIALRVEDLLTQGRRLLGRNQFDAAQEPLDQAMALAPDHAPLLSLQEELARARKRAQRQAAQQASTTQTSPTTEALPPDGPAPLTEEQRRELARHYAAGMKAIEAGRPDEAVRYWELVWALDPDYQRVREYLKREFMMRGMESFASRDLDEAIRLWEEALRVDPTDEKAAGYLARARSQQSRSQAVLKLGR